MHKHFSSSETATAEEVLSTRCWRTYAPFTSLISNYLADFVWRDSYAASEARRTSSASSRR